MGEISLLLERSRKSRFTLKPASIPLCLKLRTNQTDVPLSQTCPVGDLSAVSALSERALRCAGEETEADRNEVTCLESKDSKDRTGTGIWVSGVLTQNSARGPLPPQP